MDSLGLKFFGTRGLVSSPRPETQSFGGNTTCMQVVYQDHLILVDSGFGCTNFGELLLQESLANKKAIKVHIFYTHFHWDHIQGLPFFKPIYLPTTEIHLHSPVPSRDMLTHLDILFDGSYSPFESLLSMQAKIELHQLSGQLSIGGLGVDYQVLDHGDPAHPCFAYKFKGPDGTSIVLASDHEARPGPKNDALTTWAKGCNLLVHDAQFTEKEYLDKVGWGHSSIGRALKNAAVIEAEKTLLSHHDPCRSDATLKALHREYCLHHPKLAFEFAREDTLYAAEAKAPSIAKVG